MEVHLGLANGKTLLLTNHFQTGYLDTEAVRYRSMGLVWKVMIPYWKIMALHFPLLRSRLAPHEGLFPTKKSGQLLR